MLTGNEACDQSSCTNAPRMIADEIESTFRIALLLKSVINHASSVAPNLWLHMPRLKGHFSTKQKTHLPG